jgi:hypothetical protein
MANLQSHSTDGIVLSALFATIGIQFTILQPSTGEKASKCTTNAAHALNKSCRNPRKKKLKGSNMKLFRELKIVPHQQRKLEINHGSDLDQQSKKQ